METLRNEIIKTAAEINATEIEVITAMQGICAANGDETTLAALCELKMEFIKF